MASGAGAGGLFSRSNSGNVPTMRGMWRFNIGVIWSVDTNGEIQGLVSFIADLRNARARELEEKRINKELANIRSVQNRTIA